MRLLHRNKFRLYCAKRDVSKLKRLNEKDTASNELSRLSKACLEAAGTLQSFAVQLLTGSAVGSFENTFAGPSVYATEHARRLSKILADDPTRDIDAVAWFARCLYETRMVLFRLFSHS